MLEQAHILDINESIVATIGTMPDACPIIELRQIKELAGSGYTDTCKLTVPANHADAIYIIEGNYILFQGLDGIWHEYRIVKTEKIYESKSLIIAYGEHALYELLCDFIDVSDLNDVSAATAVTSALSGTRWTLGAADDLGNNSTYIYKSSVLAGLHQIAAQWGGEIQFRVVVSGGVIANRYVDLLSSIGSETGKRFEFGKDLLTVKQTIDRSGLLTAIIGRGKGVEIESDEGTAYGRRLEFTDIEWTTGGGDDADKPIGQNWIGDADAAAAYGYGGRHIKGVVEFDDITDAEELLRATYDYLQTVKQPKTTYEMSVITLEEVAGYDHEAVRIGDTVNVINNSVSPAITGSARVIKIDRNLIDLTDCDITLGNYIPTIANSLITQAQKITSFAGRSAVWDNANAFETVTGTGNIAYKLDLLRTQLASTTSGFSTDENGNMIFENATQTAALKLGAGILALANTKSGGEYVWRTFATGAGYTAEEMVAGTMRSDIIFTGELQAAFGSFLDLIAGDADAQHMRLRLVEDDPVFEMYANDGTSGTGVILLKDRIQIKPWVTMRQYEIGTRKGLAFFVEA